MELKPETEITVGKLPAGCYAVGLQVCRSWSETVAALAAALGVERKPRKAKPVAGAGRPAKSETK